MDLLRKEEVLFELMARGVTEVENLDLTAALKMLKDVAVSTRAPVCPYFSSEDIIIQVSMVKNNFCALLTLVNDFLEDGATRKQKRRVTARAQHWRSRCQLLIDYLESEKELQYLSTLSEVLSGFTALSAKIESLKTSDSENAALSLPTVSHCFAPVNSQLFSSNACVDSASGTVPSCVTQSVYSASWQQPILTTSVLTTPTDGYGNTTQLQGNFSAAFSFKPFELPNPLTGMLQGVNCFSASGPLEIFNFLKFFVLLRRQCSLLLLGDMQVLQILFSKASGFLRELVLRAVNCNTSCLDLHRSLISTFLPPQAFNSLLARFYFRAQGVNENLLQYFLDVKESAAALMAPYSESEIVLNIMSNCLAPEIRSLALSTTPPSTFEHLESIIMRFSSEFSGVHMDANVPRGPSHLHRRSSASSNAQIRAPANHSRSYDSLWCSYCRRRGHVRDSCFALRNRSRAQVNVSEQRLSNAQVPPNASSFLAGQATGAPPSPLYAVQDTQQYFCGIKAHSPCYLPFLCIMLNKVPFSALLDSGSFSSLIDISVCRALQVSCLPTSASCCNVSGNSLRLIGKVFLSVKIQRFSWKVPFLVVDGLVTKVILGVDFFSHSQLQLNIGSRTISFNFAPDFVISLKPEDAPVSDEPSSHMVLNNVPLLPDMEGVKLDHLSGSQCRDVMSILEQFSDVLTSKLGKTHLLTYDIFLTDTKPVRLPPYRLSPPKIKILKEHIDTMLQKGIIRPSRSSFSSPIFLVPKGDSEFRPVVDYRLLNSKIDIESVPLPEIHNCFHWFAGAKYFTSLDLNSAYHQIPLSEASKPLTAFATEWNLYEYNVVPFGIAVGAQVLTRLLDQVFGDIKFKYVYNFLDDLVIFSQTYEEHLQHITEVFSRLRSAGLTVNPSKVAFCSHQLSFLGHLVTSQGVRIDPDRTSRIRDFPAPKDAKGVARFIGMVNYFHKFIPGFADIAAPLNRLRKKGVKFLWESEQHEAFLKLKQLVANPPLLAMADFNKPFVVQTDASSLAVAAVLLQDTDFGRKPIAYASRTLTEQEKKFSTYELEALAVLFAFEKFRMYLEHVPFLLETDNMALSWVLGRPRKTGRLARWAVRISAFRYTVRHIRGSQNSVADALSRMFEVSPQQEAQVEDSPLVSAVLCDFPLTFGSVEEHQKADTNICNIIQQCQDGTAHPRYHVNNNILYCKARFDGKPKVVVPDALVPILFQYYHCSPIGGHLGIFKTLHKIREKFIWPGMDQDIKVRVKACSICTMSKPAQNTRYGFLSSSVAERPMQKIFIDFVGKLPRSSMGNCYILVCVDAFSKFTWLFPVREATSSSTIKCLQSIFASFGFPQVIVSDNATQFTSLAFQQFLFGLGIQHVTTIPYYPNPSMAERVNRNLRSALIAFSAGNHASWDKNLHWLQFSFNSARHESHGEVPFNLVMAFKSNCPLSNLWSLSELLPDSPSPEQIVDTWKRAKANLLHSHQRNKARYDRSRKEHSLKVGDSVFLKNHPLSRAADKFSAKLAPRFRGPFYIVEVLSPVSFLLEDDSGRQTRAHVSQLKT